MHPLPEQTPLKPKWSCQLPKKSSVPNAAPFSSDRIYFKTVPRLGNHSSHALGAYSHQEQILHQPMKTADVSTNNLEQIQCEEFPHRLGQPECCYFTITGNCKYKSSCRYHHPKDFSSKSHVCTLNSKGLPPRPDKRICRHYEQFGICKFGPRCLYDHPENYSSSAFQLDAFPEPSSASKLV